MKLDYVIAGTVNGKRGAAVVSVEASTEFDAEMKALAMLPLECHTHRRGKNVPEVWPLESSRGTELAIAAGLLVPDHALAN